MAAAKLNLALEQGVTYVRQLTWRQPAVDDVPGDPVDLTDCSAVLTVRTQLGGRLMVSLNSTDEGGGLDLGGDAGTIGITFSAAQAMLVNEVSGVYDLVVTKADGTTVRLIEGAVACDLAVTTGG